MFIQLGYVVLFSSAFPMAAFCALINNLIEIRSDAFKLCFIFQRPFGQRVSNIGTWQVINYTFVVTILNLILLFRKAQNLCNYKFIYNIFLQIHKFMYNNFFENL